MSTIFSSSGPRTPVGIPGHTSNIVLTKERERRACLITLLGQKLSKGIITREEYTHILNIHNKAVVEVRSTNHELSPPTQPSRPTAVSRVLKLDALHDSEEEVVVSTRLSHIVEPGNPITPSTSRAPQDTPSLEDEETVFDKAALLVKPTGPAEDVHTTSIRILDSKLKQGMISQAEYDIIFAVHQRARREDGSNVDTLPTTAPLPSFGRTSVVRISIPSAPAPRGGGKNHVDEATAWGTATTLVAGAEDFNAARPVSADGHPDAPLVMQTLGAIDREPLQGEAAGIERTRSMRTKPYTSLDTGVDPHVLATAAAARAQRMMSKRRTIILTTNAPAATEASAHPVAQTVDEAASDGRTEIAVVVPSVGATVVPSCSTTGNDPYDSDSDASESVDKDRVAADDPMVPSGTTAEVSFHRPTTASGADHAACAPHLAPPAAEAVAQEDVDGDAAAVVVPTTTDPVPPTATAPPHSDCGVADDADDVTGEDGMAASPTDCQDASDQGDADISLPMPRPRPLSSFSGEVEGVSRSSDEVGAPRPRTIHGAPTGTTPPPQSPRAHTVDTFRVRMALPPPRAHTPSQSPPHRRGSNAGSQ